MNKILLSGFMFIYLLIGFFQVNVSANGNIENSSYMFDTTQILGTTNNIKEGTAENTMEKGLTIIVEKLMIAFGVLALLMMTIGGGYMILAGGKDEILNKGKSIFTSGLIALLIALGSAIIMKLIIFLLY